MIPTELDLTIYQGATFSRVFTVPATGTPLNLTDAEPRMQIRRSVTDPLVALGFDELSGLTVTDAVAGELTLRIEADDSATLSFRKGVYDIEVEMTDGTVYRPYMGNVYVSREVTRPVA